MKKPRACVTALARWNTRWKSKMWIGAAQQDQDVLGVYAHDDNYQLCILFVRGGKLLGSKSFAPVKMKMDHDRNYFILPDSVL